MAGGWRMVGGWQFGRYYKVRDDIEVDFPFSNFSLNMEKPEGKLPIKATENEVNKIWNEKL